VPLTLYYGETKQVPFQVRGTDLATSQPLNPSTSPLQAGFVASKGGEEAPSVWYAATWDANTADNVYWGMVLVGPDGVFNLRRGIWTVWAQFTFGEETIQQPVLDSLTVR
jgi:hypothetical protein